LPTSLDDAPSTDAEKTATPHPKLSRAATRQQLPRLTSTRCPHEHSDMPDGWPRPYGKSIDGIQVYLKDEVGRARL
jgi:hypothetical protein